MTLTVAFITFVSSFRWYIIGSVLTAYVASSYRQYRRLSAFKGPRLAAWTDLWFAKSAFGIGPPSHELLADICWKYGTLARMGPDTLITNSPELVMRMSAARSPYTKGDWYHSVKIPPYQHNIFSEDDEKKHTRRRAQMIEGYSGRTNPSIEPSIDKHIRNLLNLIRAKYISTDTSFAPLDMGRIASFFTLDVITDIAYGQPFGNLISDTDMYDYMKLTEAMLPLMNRLGAVPLLRRVVQTDWVSKALFPSDKSEKGIGKMLGISKKLAHDRFATTKEMPKDMLSVFMSHGLSEKDMVAESVLSILAGSDTTATVIRATVLYTITNPSTLSKLQAEIDTYVAASTAGAEKTSTTSAAADIIQDSEARELPYLRAVIKEGLRIWAPTTGLLTKIAPPDGDLVELDIHRTGKAEKVFIPGGTSIAWTSWGVQRDKGIFGPDTDLFRPERWLIDDVEKRAYMDKVVDLNFGSGRYHCLGYPIAWMELNKCLFEVS
ncbi:hypothetical protein LZ554_004238 [Drepanopeziza brunnea f. sp. 'monogermtubi']|nr:hypothetical protein LZ554_004238 [Drepanopeziza brunnea f. sp. 'monogermtubi']